MPDTHSDADVLMQTIEALTAKVAAICAALEKAGIKVESPGEGGGEQQGGPPGGGQMPGRPGY